MTAKKLVPKILLCLFVVAFIVVCAVMAPATSATSTLWALLPPVIAICLALITKEVYSSLFVGIVVGGLLATSFNGLHTVGAVVSDGFISAVSGNAGIFIFLVLLGAMVALINKAGGSAAFGEWASKHIKTKVGASIATFLFGVLIFIDDYFNCLTVGSVMRPVTDKTKMSRAKLAYLIDATAAPICMIAPISSWAAAVSSYAPEGVNGITLFCNAIPFNFYSLMTFVFVITLTLMKFDYGPMKLHEMNALKGDLFTSGEIKADSEEEVAKGKGKVIDLVLPIIILIAISVFSLVYVGRCMGEEWVFAASQYDGSLSFIDAFANTDATVGLPWGGIIALVVTIIYLVARRVISFKDAMECIPKGFIAMVPALLILTMATTLKNMTNLLDASGFVENAMANAGALENFLPAIIFIAACFIAFSTGTSWGTFGILIPIVLAVFPVGSTLGTIGMSACLAGAVCGDHCSPISDTTIMSSAGARCDHLNHVSTQIPYAVTVAGISFVGYIIAGFIPEQYALVTLPILIVLTVATLFVIKAVTKKKA
ncbi:MAG: Na+/H+ antiporter NhaC family protein [Ruminococcaceae bacterium]|nr:Na+/H+ antiporter NhaC family protein [Oscillospiraceae bacterium]